jgi:hypothetical protein
MRRVLLFAALLAGLGVSWSAYRQTGASEPPPPLSRYVPAGSLLYLQAKDFSSLLADWDNSAEKTHWLASDNYEVFSRSRLFLRLKDAAAEFSTAAGLPADTILLRQVAGTQSALAIFDIGKLQFLYITRLASASAMQSTLWQMRGKFETRNAAGVTFFIRHDPESDREVAFAISGDYLLLATREDLLAWALQQMAGSGEHSLESETWWSQSVAAAHEVGDLRMVLNLAKIVPSPYFRSYWVQQNITDMGQYSASISDLARAGTEFREERILLKKKSASSAENADAAGPAAVADLARLVPAQAGIYQVQANPSPQDCVKLLENKILAPRLVQIQDDKQAPQVQFNAEPAGVSSALETRIDQPPVQLATDSNSSAPLKNLFAQNTVLGVLQTGATNYDDRGVFVHLHSAVVLLGQSDWDEAAVRSSLVDFVRPSFTTGGLGLEWQTNPAYSELNGLWKLAVSVRGKYLFIADDASLLRATLANLNQKIILKPAIFTAGFDHHLERGNFARLTRLLDSTTGETTPGRTPDFFSENIASLSSTLASVSSEKIVSRDAGDSVTQTVTYQWAH